MYYTLYFLERGWLAVDLVQYLDEVVAASNRPAAILKLLGFTLRITPEKPRRRGDHWVVVEIDERVLETNSPFLRAVIDEKPQPQNSPLSPPAVQRVYSALDRYDFTVHLYRK